MKAHYLLGAVATLVAHTAIAADYISTDDLKQLLKDRPIWCHDLSAEGTCTSVMHYGSVTGDSIPISEYTLLSHPNLLMKLKTSSPGILKNPGYV